MGFTRLELAAVLAGCALLAAAILPLLGATRSESSRADCFAHLRRLGHAAQLWGNDHDDRFPWITSISEGGTRPDSGIKAGAAWAEFITLSNELVSPVFLTCPSDRAPKVASHWGSGPGGFANSAFRGNALSYFLSYHGQPLLPRSVISGDRDFRPNTPGPVGCSRGSINNAAGIGVNQGGSLVEWTNSVHASAGHLLFTDGSVEYVNSAKLRSVLLSPEVQNDAGSIHFINAR